MALSNTGFKARTFRLNSSHQYADQLWTRTMSTIASPLTSGKTDSVRAAYLPNGDTAVPTIFGVLSWNSPTSTAAAECNINVFDVGSAQMVTAAAISPTRAAFTGMMATDQGVEIDGLWRIVVDSASGSLVFQKRNASGEYEIKHMVTSDPR